ncbi:hypothetical protein CN074_24980 [Sinorhizobium medicae]|uniref:hypothetical protein n=1 Tax=Sinorhizobium medicae TaxID=110321 RepID=UPI000FD747DD|nr:hypothetical protein [Sinorhizobium medicae]RVH84256.1 hypothetical protein CN201_26815 [Sinorhizobium medicae]RVP63852.1 hypothetical protein CN074_24980 [Sinorhizobium medicae]
MKLVNPHEVFKTGVSYETASASLRNKNQPVQYAVQFAYPSLQLSFMALEIYLKCLQLILLGRMETGHELHKLFRKLPDSHKAALSERWAKAHANSPYQKLPADVTKNMPKTLYDTLRHANFMHMHSRYPWERNGNQNVFIAQEVPKLLYEHILGLRPEWTLPLVDMPKVAS